ncbi:MAG: hypothetical protein WBB74_00915 [Gaiellaceae bacterium]
MIRSSRVLSALTGTGLKGAVLPQELLIFPDRLEAREAGSIGRRKSQTLEFAQITNVSVKSGLKWSTLTIEATNRDSIAIENLSRRDANTAKAEIELGIARK